MEKGHATVGDGRGESVRVVGWRGGGLWSRRDNGGEMVKG